MLSIVVMQRYQKKAVDTRIKGDMAHIRNIAAMIYNDNNKYDSLCDADNTLNENNSSQLGIDTVETDIENLTGQKPVCYALGYNYCVQTILTLGGSFCVDSFGYAGEEETYCGEGAGSNINRKCSAP